MKNINELEIDEFETERLLIKRPTMNEQKDLWNILRDEKINNLYFPTPKRFNGDRDAFLKELNDWHIQEKWYKLKVESLNDDSNIFTWSIFLKDTGEVIGQMTVQPSAKSHPEIRDVGWFVSPKYQGQGLATEFASTIIDYMFTNIEIEKIITSAASTNPGSWKLMEKLGMERIGEKEGSYIDENDNNILNYCYHITKEMYLAKKIKKQDNDLILK